MQRPLNTTPLDLLDGIACLDIKAGELKMLMRFARGRSKASLFMNHF